MAYLTATSRHRLYSSDVYRNTRRRCGALKNRSCAVMVVPSVPAQGFGSAAVPPGGGTILPLAYSALWPVSGCPLSDARTHRYAHGSSRVLDTMLIDAATNETLASASPRKPNVRILDRSENSRSLLVAKRSQTRARSSRGIPHPSSWICSSFRPPSCSVM